MARVEVVMPQMGESITEGTIIKWHKRVGERVKKDETLLEISTDKVDSEIPSPATGILSAIIVEDQKTVPINTVIAYLDTEVSRVDQEAPRAPAAADTRSTHEVTEGSVPTLKAAQESAPKVAGRFYSPLVLNIAQSEGVPMNELEMITGTGEGGRLTKKDLLAYLQAKKAGQVTPPAAVAQPQVQAANAPAAAAIGIAARPVDFPELRTKYPPPEYEVLQMSNVLQKMAEHMVKSAHTSPHVAAVHEVDMTNVVKHRQLNAEDFQRLEGYKLTFTPYIASAVVRALKKYPLVNSSIEGDKIIRKNFINLGIAVASENGLLVPVIKHAEEKNFIGLARAMHDLALRTRTKKLLPDDVQSGTFTISNYGVFGTIVGTPIINQPQVAILGTGAIRKRVAVIDDAIAIRSIAYFTMSFDHRIVDGALGGMFLEDIVQTLQNYDPNGKI